MHRTEPKAPIPQACSGESGEEQPKIMIMKRKDFLLAGTAAAIIVPIALSTWLGVTPPFTVFVTTMASVGVFWSNPLLRAIWWSEREHMSRWSNVLAFHGLVFANFVFVGALLWACTYFFSTSFIEANGSDMPAVITVIASLGTSWVFGVLSWLPLKQKQKTPLRKKVFKPSFWKGLFSKKNESQTK